MPDFLNLHSWYGVCGGFEARVEELAPGVRRFSERVAVTYMDGRPAEEAYYAFEPRRYLSGTCVAERSTPKLSAAGTPMKPEDLPIREDHLEFDAARVGGRHLWVGTASDETRWFLSDELGKRVLKAKLKKLGPVPPSPRPALTPLAAQRLRPGQHALAPLGIG